MKVSQKDIPKKILRKERWKQFKQDLIGKDSHRGVTLTYAWLANQFGHFSLGFIPTFIVFLILQKFDLGNELVVGAISFAAVALGWTFFEIYNVLKPLISAKKPIRWKQRNVFDPHMRSICYDTFTDLCFFWIGGAASVFILLGREFIVNFLVFGAAVVLLIILVFIFGRYWYTVKLFQQKSKFPFQFRLSQWTYPEPKKYTDQIKGFMESDLPQHMLIFGESGSGKTSLAVGLTTEKFFSHQRGLYTTAMKFFDILLEDQNRGGKTKDVGNPWSWKDTQWLIIDDINPSNLKIIEPEQVLREIKPKEDHITISQRSTSSSRDNQPLIDNKKFLQDKKVIWVVGNPKLRSEWEKMIEEDLKIQDHVTIELNSPRDSNNIKEEKKVVTERI